MAGEAGGAGTEPDVQMNGAVGDGRIALAIRHSARPAAAGLASRAGYSQCPRPAGRANVRAQPGEADFASSLAALSEAPSTGAEFAAASAAAGRPEPAPERAGGRGHEADSAGWRVPASVGRRLSGDGTPRHPAIAGPPARRRTRRPEPPRRAVRRNSYHPDLNASDTAYRLLLPP